MNSQKTTIAILATLSVSLALAEDFKTINGKEYKNGKVSRVEADGIIVKTAGGISKIYFVELPKDVADKWLARIRAGEQAAEEKRIKEQRAAEEKRIKEQQAAEEKRAAAERERAEKDKVANADLKRSLEQFQAAEQRAAQSYQSATKGTLSGQIFVATQGAENYKLGAVQVGLFARNSIDMLIPALKNYADRKIQQQPDKSHFYRSGAFYLSLLNSAIQTAESDADGRFRIEVPRTGNFVIAAQAERWVAGYPDGHTEHYYWLQPVSLDGQQERTQNLSNKNLTSATGTSSLVLTQD
jgi:hypothetical protein